MRIAIAGLQHETNSFAPDLTEAEDFAAPRGWPALVRGAALPEALRGTSAATAGALQALDAAGGQAVPVLWAMALPSGPVRHAAFTGFRDEIVAGLRAALPLDGVFLELHGAMATTEEDDAEGDLLDAVRAAVGPDVPLVASLDLHANVSQRMVDAADHLEAYLTYPHVDMADTGKRAMLRLLALAGGAPRPARAFRQPPFLLPLVVQATGSEPMRTLYENAARRVSDGAAAAVTLTLGFPLADVPDAGPAIIVAASDRDTSEHVADALLEEWLEAQPRFSAPLLSPEEAVARALSAVSADGPVVLADVQDNPGGGGSNDTTGLLHALLEGGAAGAVLVHIADAPAVAAATAAGVGGEMNATVGGRSNPDTGAPVPGPWRVLALGDGRFTGEGPMYAHNAISMGPVALVEQSGVRVILAEGRMQASEPGLLRHLGLAPEHLSILAVKSSVHFRGAYEKMARKILLVTAPGRVPMDLSRLAFTKSARPPVGVGSSRS